MFCISKCSCLIDQAGRYLNNASLIKTEQFLAKNRTGDPGPYLGDFNGKYERTKKYSDKIEKHSIIKGSGYKKKKGRDPHTGYRCLFYNS